MAEFPSIAAVPAAYPANGQNGAIGGGVLRPGAIDQGAFQQLLQAQYRAQNQGKAPTGPTGMTLSDYRKLAGNEVASGATIPAGPPIPAVQPNPTLAAPPGDGIPTLSLEQFAALTGMSLPESVPDQPPAPLDGMGEPQGLDQPLAAGAVETADAGALPADTAAPVDADMPDMADGVPIMPPVAETDSPARSPNSRVELVDSVPDREEQHRLAAHGKTWRLKETPGAKELFLGPDGEFGWDDFIDIINPLQHIPVVAQIYRAVTGDQAYGLSAFIGAAPFGPLSLASAVADTVIRAQTGRDAGTDFAARVLGIDNRTPEEADLHLGRDGQDQMAASGDGTAPVQVADATFAQAAASADSWTRDGAGVARD